MIRKIPDFWRRDAGPSGRLLSRLLAPLGALYGAATLRRMARRGWRAPVPVISIGNATLGGAGKTPTAIALATAFIARGEKPVFITRGYGGQEKGPLLVQPADHAAGDVGDEALLLAQVAPTIVARDRAAGARLATAQGASLILLDDALQNPALQKDFSLCVVDAAFGFGNRASVPAGPLRAPLAGMLPAIDAFLIIGDDRSGLSAELSRLKPVFAGRIAPATDMPELLGKKVVAYSGIALPEKFEASLAQIGAEIVASRRFGDHHVFGARDAQALLALAHTHQATLVTTGKDFVRLAGDPALEELAAASTILPVRLVGAEALAGEIYRALLSVRSRMSTASGPA
ncbi:MAG: tetraacyldisaccharide 4'-kinase [Proteobacteria bacterium]|nr:tetraacyldisaccharide 4'-kinase [Pseudomonadota bacterium]